MEDAYERKNLKYQELVKDCQQNEWKIRFFAVEVGCRGFVGQSMWRALRAMGITRAARRSIGCLCRKAGCRERGQTNGRPITKMKS